MNFSRAITFLSTIFLFFACKSDRIDREAVVKRHIPFLAKVDTLSPFTVGNGEFAYTVDVTGLQTFPDVYENKFPLGTQSHWGWHSVANPNNYTLEDAFKYYDTYGRKVPYASKQRSEAGQWLRANPHRLHLGRLGFQLRKSDGSEIEIENISAISQKLNIWEGIIYSKFDVENRRVNVETACFPRTDQVAVRIKSDLLQTGRVGIRLEFPYGSLSWGKKTADWNGEEMHTSEIVSQDANSVIIERTLDSTKYFVALKWNGNAKLKKNGKHSLLLEISEENQFEFTCGFSRKDMGKSPNSVQQIFDASKTHWRNFWETGGAIDLSESTDSRAFELERRIILSRYLTAVQCAGSLPPAETGLTFNSWYGKFHLEMHWWHGVHFPLWGHPELLEKSMAFYETAMPEARAKAERQGYEGVRWPKMIGFDGRESPSTVGVFLIWQQPHPIYFAELLYRSNPNQKVLDKYKNIVFETAMFMASYPHWENKNNRYVLGPPLIPAQEIYKATETYNACFELSYWTFGLKTAQAWRERLGLPRVEKWDHVIQHLSELPQNNGTYQNAEIVLDTFEDEFHRNDHPMLLGAFGMIPNDSIDVRVMQNTLDQVLVSWNWERTWGWDYPMIAMTAARAGRPESAIKALLMDVRKNTYLNNGHNYQDDQLTIYLPGNGGLLTAVAMMAAGWDGAPSDINAPGFPQDGSWVVKFEGLNPLP